MKFQAEASAPIPPWKLELLSRKSALARAIEPNLSQILDEDKSRQVITTTWKDVAKGGAVPNRTSPSVGGAKRPLPGETATKTNGFYESSSTCATLFNGDGGRSSGGDAGISRSSASASVVRCEGGASSSATISAPLSPSSSSSLDWSQSSWPAHRPSRLDFRTSAATDKQAAVTPPPPANRDQFNLIDSSSGVVNALPTKRILFDEEPGSPRHQARPPIVRNQQLQASLKMGEDNAVTSAFPTTDKSDHVLDELATDSDSSEEIHYGPGFVSRLKSRYMSAALRSSSTSGGLRRTASLEDFLDKDKEEVSIELSVHHQPPKQQPSEDRRFQRKSSSDERSSRSRTAATGVASHVNRKARESIKRCQSVEVLARNKLEDSKPPPLPPKSATHLETVLNSEGLANDKVQLSEKRTKATSSDSSSSSSTVIASLRRPFHYRRRSAGLLFGVEEKELPAPDTVKETRKIFETKSGTHTARPALIKSRSTSSLYSATKPSSPVRNYRQQKSVETKKPLVSNSKPALPAKPKKPDLTPIKKKNKFEVPPLRHVEGSPKKEGKKNNNASIELEEGIKIVSPDSINKIRAAAGESFSFNFSKSKEVPSEPPKPAARKPYLPNKKCSAPPPPPPSKTKVDTIDNATVHAVPVGVIKPITRVPKEDNKQKSVALAAAPTSTSSSAAIPSSTKRAESPTTTLNNLINLTKQTNALKTTKESSKESEEKEVILIDKKHDLEPILKTATAAKASHNTNSNSRVYASKIVTFAEDLENKRPLAPAVVSTPPVASSPTKDNSDEGIDYEDEDMDSKSNYRDSWKKRQEAETKNTMVFNFLNSQKDVTHIENDGLDLSKRKKKQHLQQMSKVRWIVFFQTW